MFSKLYLNLNLLHSSWSLHTLHTVLTRFKELNLTLKKEKCQLYMHSTCIGFFAMVFGADGTSPVVTGLVVAWWQGWPSGESTCFPPMWSGFDFRTRRHTWIEFVGSLLCYERFSPGYSGFPLSPKTNI